MSRSKLAVLCTINNDEEHTLRFVEHYRDIGHCMLILFLDDPGHVSYFDPNELSGSVTLNPCDEEYWLGQLSHLPVDMPEKQHTNIRRGAEIAREKGCDWCVSVDSDELILNLPSLISRLDELGTDFDLLRLLPAELIHDRESAFSRKPFAGRYFKFCMRGPEIKTRLKRLPVMLRIRLLMLRKITRRLFFGHTNGKTVFRLDAPITSYKQHRQFSDTRELIESVLPGKYVLLHFDAMNFDTWLFKWRRRIFGTTRATALSDERRRQTERIAKSLQDSSGRRARKLFRKWFVFDRAEIEALIDAGLVFEVSG